MSEEAKMGLTEEDVKHRDEGEGIAGLFAAMGDKNADAGAIAKSEDGIETAKRMELMSMSEDESEAYWREKGLIKELHGEGLEKWSGFVPVSSQSEPGRKYPLIFCLHGAHNPIRLTESYGVMQVAAKEECVVIAPENENWESIEGLLNYARENYPVDLSRVYTIGYSFGGFMSSRNSLCHPEIFAGAGMGGMLFAGDVVAHELDGQPYPEYRLSGEMLDRAGRLKLPALIFMGENEMLELLPLWRSPNTDVRDGVIPLESGDKQKALNNWRRAAGCGPLEFLAEGEGENEVERAIGARFEKSEVRTIRGRKYFIGDSVNADGECLLRVVACEKMVHWPTPAFAELVWEHISRFARNVETGELERL